MGHLGHLKEEYQALITRLDAGQVGLPAADDPAAEAARRELLEILYTPEEAALAAKLPVKPASLARIAARVGLEPEALRARLEPMCDKGLVMDIVSPRTGKTRYMLSPPVVGFFEFSLMRANDTLPQKRIAEALEAYTERDPAFAYEVFGPDTVIGRAMVREEHIAAEALPEVLDWERTTALIEGASKLAVSTCYCRHKAEHLEKDCDAPKEVCLSLNGGADFVARRGFGREIDREEAFEILQRARKAGLVQIADNVQNQPSYVCNCCACCCGQLSAINHYDLHGVTPSGFDPVSDAARCKGCSRCSRACPVGAVTMVPERVVSERKNTLRPRFDLDRCIGCGLCAEACKTGAIAMERAPERPNVPANAIERVIRMSIERGKLAHLLVDEGESRGHRFLNDVLKVLTRLPAAQRLLASEQVKSRFVKAAMATVKDPSR